MRMNEFNSILALANDKNSEEVRVLSIKHLIENDKFSVDLEDSPKNCLIKTILKEKSKNSKVKMWALAFREATNFSLYKAVITFHKILSNDLSSLLNQQKRNFTSLVDCQKFLREQKINAVEDDACYDEDFTFEQLCNTKSAHIILIYVFLQKINGNRSFNLHLGVGEDNNYYLYDIIEKVSLSPYDNWKLISQTPIKLYDDYSLFKQFILKNYWVALIQGDLNTIYDLDQIMKYCFKNYQGYTL